MTEYFTKYENDELVDVRNFNEGDILEITVFLGDSDDYGDGIFTSAVEERCKNLYEQALEEFQEIRPHEADYIELPEPENIREEDSLLFHLGTLRADLSNSETSKIEDSAEKLEFVADYMLEGMKEDIGL